MKCSSCGNTDESMVGCYVEANILLAEAEERLNMVGDAIIDYESSNGTESTIVSRRAENIKARLQRDIGIYRTILRNAGGG